MEKLIGIDAISNYTQLSIGTLVEKIKFEGFPAKRNNQGSWEADPKEIDKWSAPAKRSKKKATKKK